MNNMDFLFFSKRENQEYIPTHFHKCFELVYYYGNGHTKIGSTAYTFRKNTFALISPYTEHHELHLNEADVLFVGFNSDREGLSHLNGVFEDDKDGTIENILLRMKTEFVQQQNDFSDMLNLLVGELSIHLLRVIGIRRASKQQSDRMHYVLNFMDEHFCQKISIQTLADLAGYSYGRFRHLFKEKYGVAPLQYLYVKRLNYARSSLILHPKKLISEVALDAGFVNDAQFCSMFKRENGISPKQYRLSKAWKND
ncbi:helix-turn-helix domain-containing protein [Paenibacillus sp. GCM10012307]|uniref:Helix-turn-helix transcriptional regulator n=1 Tax=Paenibacillus roseus TaxID=2798579 RepID=A0A934J6X9_9BACL|nr:AraC family transcriptional regulator [Paenibacillus roseus]MBJ6361507.1 helix-turn-helix transcriptional regulator [Paenibacillus roseus]